MTWFDFFWTSETIAHIEEHGMTVEEVEFVIEHPEIKGFSRSSGDHRVEGESFNGKYIIAIYEMLDDITIMPITAFTPDKD